MDRRQRHSGSIHPAGQAQSKRLYRAFQPDVSHGVLDAHLFANLGQVQAITDEWLVDYNDYRPHEALSGVPPVPYMPRLTHAPNLYRPLST